MFFKSKKNSKYNVLILGNKGMLGSELYDAFLKLSCIKDSVIGTVIGLDKNEIDVSIKYTLENFFQTSIHFDYCINCVAYTNTNLAQTTREGITLDYTLNALVPKYIAKACKNWNVKLIHISTDYVFSEMSPDSAWSVNNSTLLFKEYSEPCPCNIYGYDKLIGEMNIKEVFGKNSEKYCIARTSWIYGMHNNKSFIHKFISNLIKNMNEGKREIEMTSNECSVPTPCAFVIDCILDIITNNISGIYHAVPNVDKNGVTRFEFAQKILDFLKLNKYYTAKKDFINFLDVKLVPVDRDSYWPKNSVMKSSSISCISWDTLLDAFLNKNSNEISNFIVEQDLKFKKEDN